MTPPAFTQGAYVHNRTQRPVSEEGAHFPRAAPRGPWATYIMGGCTWPTGSLDCRVYSKRTLAGVVMRPSSGSVAQMAPSAMATPAPIVAQYVPFRPGTGVPAGGIRSTAYTAM